MRDLNFSYVIGACKGHTASTTGCGNATVQETNSMIKEVLALPVPSERVFWDVHSPSPAELPIEVANYSRLGSKIRTVVLEENGVTHDLGRALSHAVLNNAYQRLGENVVPIAGYPDMLQAYQQMDRWGGTDEVLSNDWSQGQLFFLPNTTFGQPTYYVNQMIARSYQPNGLNLSVSNAIAAGTVVGGVDCFAAGSDSGAIIVLRCVNNQPQDVSVTVALAGVAAGQWIVDVSTMSGYSPSLNNTPASPRLVAPVQTLSAILKYGETALNLPPFSFTVVTMTHKTKQ
jgi:hypothetical protein